MNDNQAVDIHNSIMDFLPAYYRYINPVVNYSEYNGNKLQENQVKIIAAINHVQQPVTPGLLSRILNIQKGSLTRMLRSLENYGLLSKRDDDNDERQYFIETTPEGRRFFNEHMQSCQKTFTDLFSDMPDEDLRKVNSGFNTIIQYLNNKEQRNERSGIRPVRPMDT